MDGGWIGYKAIRLASRIMWTVHLCLGGPTLVILYRFLLLSFVDNTQLVQQLPNKLKTATVVSNQVA